MSAGVSAGTSTDVSTQGALAGKVALVAGATRGAGRAMAVELGAAGATVYATGRTTRERISEVGRATETIEETAELVTAAGGTGIAVPTDHLEPEQVRALVERIDRERGRLDILVNDVWGGEALIEFDTKTWETNLTGGLRMLRLGVETHLITSYYALPLLIRHPGGLVVEVTDGTAEFNRTYRLNLFYDLAKNAPIRAAFGLGEELKEFGGTAVSVSPGFLRSEQMLDHFGVTEANWRDAVEKEPHFAIAESPRFVGRAVAALAADPERARWNGKSIFSGDLAKVYGFTDLDGSRPDVSSYFRDVVFGDKKATADDYR
ncbi:SDR family oxidoreductase [Streptomyces hygroscopicus subsp. hygroscopicus]|uniref:SDR family oxidoreductase n=1 Tax=Streptomyces hygroscopicus TaxID=1912 RepID=UPI001C65D476|nr:SDR family oxidoreductase [Streptomyces hygroscopicus subsp. hygroscopicus]